MKTYFAKIDIMPRKELLDPQGNTIQKNMDHVGIIGVSQVRMGKHIEIAIQAQSKDEANQHVELACKKLLTNLITESYQYTVEEMQ